MKILGALFVALIVLIQYPLWLGKGGWLKASQLDTELERKKAANSRLEVRNSVLAAEVRDLKQGTEAIEERARYELGMTRPDEVFFQYQDSPAPPAGNPRAQQ